MSEEITVTPKLERYFDMALGWLTRMMVANPRKVAVGIMVLVGLLVLSQCSR